MADDIREVLILPKDINLALQSVDKVPSKKSQPRIFARLRNNLKKTRRALTTELKSSIGGEIDDATWEGLEEALIRSDISIKVAVSIIGELEEEAAAGGFASSAELQDRLLDLLASRASRSDGRLDLSTKPAVILVTGVNGSGKTTTIAKLAAQLKQIGLRVTVGAADTFRAAAVEQLELWAERVGCEFVKGVDQADPSSVAYDAVKVATEQNSDVVIIDTAGRLHTDQNLMSELKKIAAVIAKQLPQAPNEVLLVVDSTTGQNGLRQAQEFKNTVGVSGIVLTKLDGTAKGGIALTVQEELGVPVKLIGIGEEIDDLRPFNAREFAQAILSAEE